MKNISLRGMALFITLVCVWLAMTVNSARRQAKSVARIHSLRGLVLYDYQAEPVENRMLLDSSIFGLGVSLGTDLQSPWPTWLIRAVGLDFFHCVETVSVGSDRPVVDTREIVSSLPGLKELDLHGYARCHAGRDYCRQSLAPP